MQRTDPGDQMTRNVGRGHEFDRGIEVSQIGEGEYAAELDGGWAIGAGINGGYALAVAGNAIREALGPAQPDPFSVSAYYLAASRPGPATVRTRVLRRGGSLSTVSASLVQSEDGAEVERIAVLAAYGDLAALPDDVRTTATEPEVAPMDQCIPTALAPADFKESAPLLDRLGTLLDPASIGWATGNPSGNGEIKGWFRFADGRDLDPIGLLMALDALPPVTYDLGIPGWAPTLELTCHVRARPAPGWAKVRHATRNLAHGHFEEDCEIWDSEGRLVAQSRQLARVPRPVRKAAGP